jgi:hypothetical protein
VLNYTHITSLITLPCSRGVHTKHGKKKEIIGEEISLMHSWLARKKELNAPTALELISKFGIPNLLSCVRSKNLLSCATWISIPSVVMHICKKNLAFIFFFIHILLLISVEVWNQVAQLNKFRVMLDFDFASS